MALQAKSRGWRPSAGILLLAVLVPAGPGEADEPAGAFRAGRSEPGSRDFRISAALGTLSEIQGAVEETTRAYYDATDQTFKQDFAEAYDLNDFDITDGYTTIGFSLESMWKYFTLQLDTAIFNAESDTVAKRNYYIGVGEDIEFQGQGYDNLLIPEGTPFRMEMIAAVIELRGLYTPFTYAPNESIRVTPWVGLGLFGFVGQYDIDAGNPSGVTPYLYPPEDFVIGGQSEGLAGLGLPEIGMGGELRLGREGGANVILQMHYAVCRYDGSTKYIVSSRHREKNADIDHVNMETRCMLEFPMAENRAFLLGIQYQYVESEADITHAATTEEEIIESRERFDKRVDFKMEALTAMAGVTF